MAHNNRATSACVYSSDPHNIASFFVPPLYSSWCSEALVAAGVMQRARHLVNQKKLRAVGKEVSKWSSILNLTAILPGIRCMCHPARRVEALCATSTTSMAMHP